MCPPVTCSPGYKPDLSISAFKSNSHDRSIYKKIVGYLNHTGVQVKVTKTILIEVTSGFNFNCTDWACLPVDDTCDRPKCPPNTQLSMKWTTDKCPVFMCLTRPINEKECTVNGKLISTFDGLVYKYDICHHILAQDNTRNAWSVISK